MLPGLETLSTAQCRGLLCGGGVRILGRAWGRGNLHDSVQWAVDPMCLPAGCAHLDKELLSKLPLATALKGVNEGAAGDYICQHSARLHVIKHLSSKRKFGFNVGRFCKTALT